MKDKAIIFFTRIPTKGKTKTRLEPFLNKDLCVELQTAFIKDIYNNIKDIDADIIVSYSDHGDLETLKNTISKDIFFLKQKGKDLGMKMHSAISFSLKRYKKVVLIGSDIPLIRKKDIEIGFELLEVRDIVIAPTHDGGYYLIGMSEENRDIFNIRYSTSKVFKATIDKIENIGKSFGVGNIQLDIDDKEDFLKLYEILKEDKDILCDNTRKLINKIMEKRDNSEKD